ncbi:MAG: hydrolase 1, exosortase A system-associated [Sphingomonas sp.]
MVGTLDTSDGSTGLLIVSGGNEVRVGAHRGMASLAARLAAGGTPVFRYDRRGIGDSSGENRGFLESAPDIAAAAATFAAETGIRRMVAFGNCDAATALAFFHGVAGIDSLVLANPWVVESGGDLPPAAAIRARYAERLRDPRTLGRLLRGGINLRKLSSGLSKVFAEKSEADTALTERFIAALDGSATPATIILASRDATALAFMDAIKAVKINADIHRLDTGSHSFAREPDQAALESIVRGVIA